MTAVAPNAGEAGREAGTPAGALIVTADYRVCRRRPEELLVGVWFGRVVDGGQTVFDAAPKLERSWAIQLALASPQVGQARRQGRPVYVRSEKEQEAFDDE